MTARGRWLLVGIGAVVLTTAAATAPTMLRRVDAFNVQRVEVHGTHYMGAYDAVVQSGITRRSSVFEDFAPWRAKLIKHPLVLDANIERRLPNTLQVTITETTPVALVRNRDLRPVDARMKELPIDPANADLDLPLVTLASKPVVEVLAMLQTRDARLFSWISEAAQATDHGVRLELRNPAGAEIMVPNDSRAIRVNEMEVAIADLAARGELPRIKRIDARFHDQIVVSLKNGN
ncbi:MAG TPA: FtsQ-type POTRA domain-containing protein [Longimicrobiales bacterium]|nr:FtsQ-type POTRA domain-containing protein [Longimicrobiales bacterium]